MTTQVQSQRRMALYRNVRPLLMPPLAERDEALAKAEAMLVEIGVLMPGNTYAITCGEPMGTPGAPTCSRSARCSPTTAAGTEAARGLQA